MKLFEKIIGGKLRDIRYGNDLLDVSHKGLRKKIKRKLHYRKIYNLCASKDKINKIKGQPIL